MNRERAAKATALRNLALQYERGDLDAEFAAAEPADVPVMRATVARRLREVAAALAPREPSA